MQVDFCTPSKCFEFLSCKDRYENTEFFTKIKRCNEKLDPKSLKALYMEFVSSKEAVKETTTTIPTNGTKKRKRDDSVVPLVPVIPVIEGVVIEKSRTLSDDKKITLAAKRIRTGEWKEQTR